LFNLYIVEDTNASNIVTLLAHFVLQHSYKTSFHEYPSISLAGMHKVLAPSGTKWNEGLKQYLERIGQPLKRGATRLFAIRTRRDEMGDTASTTIPGGHRPGPPKVLRLRRRLFVSFVRPSSHFV